MTEYTLEQINRMTREAFTEAFGDIYEHSAWIAEQAWPARPFADLEALCGAFVEVVRGASDEQRLSLLNAHPELAGREATAGSLTAASSQEQAGAGLVDLAPEELAHVARFNGDYRAKFGFPFIIAVRNHTKSTIMQAMETRLGNDRDAELRAALEQVFEIARLRLENLIV
jgi:2-oxo-4-hydroxy-4-carboxy-5-ureidoimidazoline decarboxylase